MPVPVQIGERVEDVEAQRSDLGQRVVHRHREPLEPHRRVDEPRLHVRPRLAVTEADVHDPPPVAAGLRHERRRDRREVRQRVDPPHDVVAQAQPVDDPVQTPVPGAHRLHVGQTRRSDVTGSA